MKALLLTTFLTVFAHLAISQPDFRFIDKHHTQVDLGNELFEFFVNIRPSADEFRPLTAGFSVTPDEQTRKIRLLLNELLKYPEDFRGKYCPENIFLLGITNSSTKGYHMANLVIVEGRSEDPDLKFYFHHEVAHNLIEKREGDPELEKLLDKLTQLRKSTSTAGHHQGRNIFGLGYVTQYAKSEVEEEFCEIFASLMTPNSNGVLVNYIASNPESVLASKTELIIRYLETVISDEMDLGYFQQFSGMVNVASLR